MEDNSHSIIIKEYNSEEEFVLVEIYSPEFKLTKTEYPLHKIFINEILPRSNQETFESRLYDVCGTIVRGIVRKETEPEHIIAFREFFETQQSTPIEVLFKKEPENYLSTVFRLTENEKAFWSKTYIYENKTYTLEYKN